MSFSWRCHHVFLHPSQRKVYFSALPDYSEKEEDLHSPASLTLAIHIQKPGKLPLSGPGHLKEMLSSYPPVCFLISLFSGHRTHSQDRDIFPGSGVTWERFPIARRVVLFCSFVVTVHSLPGWPLCPISFRN